MREIIAKSDGTEVGNDYFPARAPVNHFGQSYEPGCRDDPGLPRPSPPATHGGAERARRYSKNLEDEKDRVYCIILLIRFNALSASSVLLNNPKDARIAFP